MRLIIAGGRDIPVVRAWNLIDDFVTGLYEHTDEVNLMIVHGGCPARRRMHDPNKELRSVDAAADNYARSNNIPFKVFYPDWDMHGKRAGPLRNKKMAKYGDVLYLIWDGKSKGSANMKYEMEKLGKPVYEEIIEDY